LARRAWLVDQLKSRFPETPVVLLDCGNLSDVPTDAGDIKTRGLVEGMARLGYAASNVGERDLSRGYAEFLRRTEGAGFPFVSTNIVREDTREPVFPPYVIVDVPVPDRKDPLRLGILGVVRFNPVFRKPGPDGTRVMIVPPLDAVQRYIGEVKERSDAVVLLGLLHKDDAKIIAAEIDGLDFILGAYGKIYSTREEVVGSTHVLYVGNMGQRIGESRLSIGGNRDLESSTNFIHYLTAKYPVDPEMESFVNEVRAEAARVNAAQRQASTAPSDRSPERTANR
jgi:2',3'-cyclic-nucleotide 2'-phosphodiesterase (5'-nucleotidase family)